MKHHFENKNLLAVAAPDTKSGTAEYLLEVVVSLVSSAFSVARVLADLTSGRSVATSRSITAGWSSAARSIISLVRRVVVAILCRVWLFLGSFQVNGLGTLLLCLQGCSLSGSACHRSKLSLADEVLKVDTWGKDDVDALDLISGESLAVFCTLAGERNPEVTQLVKLYLLALQEHLHQALAHVGNNALHLTTSIATMVSNVLGEITERQYLAHLSLGVSLWVGTLVDRVWHHKYRIINHTFAHCRYGTWYLRKQSLRPAEVKLYF